MKISLRALPTILVVAFAFWFIAVEYPKRSDLALESIKYQYLGAAFFIAMLVPIFSSMRVESILSGRLKFHFRFITHKRNISSIIAGILFFNFLGQAIARTYQYRSDAQFQPITMTFIERAATLIVSLLVGLISIVLILNQNIEFSRIYNVNAFYFIFASSFLCISTLFVSYFFMSRRDVHIVRSAIELFLRGASRLTRGLSRSILFSFLIYLCNFFVLCLVIISFESSLINPEILLDRQIFLFIPLVMLAASLPLSIGGFGGREGALAVVWFVMADAPTEGVAIGVATGLIAIAAIGVHKIFAQMMADDSGTRVAPHDQSRSDDQNSPDLQRIRHAALIFAALAGACLVINPRVSAFGFSISVSVADVFFVFSICAIAIAVILHDGNHLYKLLQSKTVFFLGIIIALSVSLLIGFFYYGSNLWAFNNRFLGIVYLFLIFFLGFYLKLFFKLISLKLCSVVFSISILLSFIYDINVSLFGAIYCSPPGESGFCEFYSYIRNISGITYLTPNRNQFAFFSIISYISLMYFFLRRMRANSFMYYVICMMPVITFFTGSRSGIGAIILISLFLALFFPRFIFKTTVVSFLVFIFLIGFEAFIKYNANFELPTLFEVRNDPTQIFADRWYGYSRGVEMWLEAPIFGLGLGSFIDETKNSAIGMTTIHNTFLWIAAETGLFGLILIFAPLFLYSSRLLRVIFRDGAVNRYDEIFFIALIGAFALMSLLHDMAYQRPLWFFAGLLLPLSAEQKNQMRRRTRPAA